MTKNIIPRICRALAGALFAVTFQYQLPAQQAPTSSDPLRKAQSAEDELVTLSAYTVRSTQGGGYVANDAYAGLKTKQLLLDIPQAVQIIPRDMIDDLGFTTNTTELVKFASSGIISMGYGEGVQSRGFRSSNPLIDGQLDTTYKSDPVSFDSFEVLKGPAAVLYGARSDLSGIIIKNTKKPLHQPRHLIRSTVGNGGLLRAELDVTGPLGTIGGVPVQYRFIAATQQFDGFHPTDYDNRVVFNGSLNFDLSEKTSLLVQADNVHSRDKALTDFFVDATGTETYTGSGYEKGYSAKWDQMEIKRLWTKATLNHRFSDSWEMKTSLSSTSMERTDREIRNSAMPNYTLGTIQQYFFGWDFSNEILSVGLDVSGKYRLFGLNNTSNFGFGADHYRSLGAFWFIRTKPPTSITNPDSYDTPMPVFDKSNQEVPTDHEENFAWAYYMHQLDIIENKLFVTAGLSMSYIGTTDVNTSTKVASIIRKRGYPRRLGIVYKPFDGVAVYANNSTAFRNQGGFSAANISLPPVVGEVKEVGVKTSLFGGKISTTATYFQLDVTDLAVPDFNNPPYSKPAGKQKNKGYELDLAFRPFPEWTIMGTLYAGNIKDALTGIRLANSTNHTASLLTKYEFSNGPLKGFNFGGSAYHQGSRFPLVAWKGYEVYNAFFGYRTKNWDVMVNVDNLTDESYNYGVVAAYYLDIANPRTTKLTIAYRF